MPEIAHIPLIISVLLWMGYEKRQEKWWSKAAKWLKICKYTLCVFCPL